jgi:hypothetical protein
MTNHTEKPNVKITWYEKLCKAGINPENFGAFFAILSGLAKVEKIVQNPIQDARKNLEAKGQPDGKNTNDYY